MRAIPWFSFLPPLESPLEPTPRAKTDSGASDQGKTDFLPAAGLHFLTPLYELLSSPLLGGVWRSVVEDVCTLAPTGTSVVDLGCGPATVLSRLAERRPDLSLTGVDIDERILAIAQRRLPSVRFLQGSIDAVPLEEKSADVVMTSMVFHHLKRALKPVAFHEALRIVKPGGRLLLCDFSTPTNRRGAWIVGGLGKLERGIARQGASQLLEIAASESLTLVPRWTCIGCITQYEVKKK